MTAVPCPTPWGCVGLCLQGSGGAEGGACGLWELGWVRGAQVELKGMGGVPVPITLGMVLVGADAVWPPWAEPLAWPPAPDQHRLPSARGITLTSVLISQHCAVDEQTALTVTG